MAKKTFTVIAYDISKDKKRNKLSKFLLNYGVRVNYSVFECMLTKTQTKVIEEFVRKLINSKTDRVLMYQMCKACFVKNINIGRTTPFKGEVTLIV